MLALMLDRSNTLKGTISREFSTPSVTRTLGIIPEFREPRGLTTRPGLGKVWLMVASSVPFNPAVLVILFKVSSKGRGFETGIFLLLREKLHRQGMTY